MSNDLNAQIDRLVMDKLVTFVRRRDAGISDSMNGALDYLPLEIVRLFKEAGWREPEV